MKNRKNRIQGMQKSFRRYWISEKEANQQLAWVYFWSLVSISLTILSLLH